jgi:hypothetical protein
VLSICLLALNFGELEKMDENVNEPLGLAEQPDRFKCITAIVGKTPGSQFISFQPFGIGGTQST